MPKTGGTFTGPVILANDATDPKGAVTKHQLDTEISNRSRFQQWPNKTIVVDPSGNRYLFVSDRSSNNDWGVYDSPNNAKIALPISSGGTGSTTLVGAQSALGIVPQLITTLYPGGSAGSPPSIGINQRIDVANPFPGRNINFRVEILLGGIWGDPGFGSNIGTGALSFGVVARDYNGAITIVSGVTAVGIYSNLIGNGFNSSAGITTAQYRVIVWTIV